MKRAKTPARKSRRTPAGGPRAPRAGGRPRSDRQALLAVAGLLRGVYLVLTRACAYLEGRAPQFTVEVAQLRALAGDVGVLRRRIGVVTDAADDSTAGLLEELRLENLVEETPRAALWRTSGALALAQVHLGMAAEYVGRRRKLARHADALMELFIYRAAPVLIHACRTFDRHG